jgi:quercetin dioxygenase-like cupin family protein
MLGKLFTATPTTQTAMVEDDRRGFVTAGGDGQTLTNPAGAALTFLARAEQTGGAMTAFETGAAPGEGPPLHTHVREDEVLYVLRGRLRIRLDEEIQVAPAGSFVFIPKGVPHSWQNVGDDQVRFLVVFTPAALGMEQFFERSAELGEANQVAEAFKRFASDAGMKVLGPPMAESDAVA